MKKILTIFMVFSSAFLSKAQTIGLTGPSNAKHLDDIVLTFTGETNARYIVSANLDRLGSTYNSNYLTLGEKGFTLKTSTQGASKVVQAVFLYSGLTNNESVTFKINYSYNGTSGAGNGVAYKTITISPPPIVIVPPTVDPTVPTVQDLAITVGPSSSDQPLSINNFSVSTMPLLFWTINKNIPSSSTKLYGQSSSTSSFGSVTRSEEIISFSGFTHGLFAVFNGGTITPGFTQGTYFRTKLVYKGKDYYSNVVFVPQ